MMEKLEKNSLDILFDGTYVYPTFIEAIHQLRKNDKDDMYSFMVTLTSDNNYVSRDFETKEEGEYERTKLIKYIYGGCIEG